MQVLKLQAGRQVFMLEQHVTLYTLISCLLLSTVLNNNLRRKRPPHQRFIYYIIPPRLTAAFIQLKTLHNQRGDQSSGYLKCFFPETLESQLCESLGYPQQYQTTWYFPNIQLGQKLKVTVWRLRVFFPPALNKDIYFFLLQLLLS